jgi:hypothetical protein
VQLREELNSLQIPNDLIRPGFFQALADFDDEIDRFNDEKGQILKEIE